MESRTAFERAPPCSLRAAHRNSPFIATTCVSKEEAWSSDWLAIFAIADCAARKSRGSQRRFQVLLYRVSNSVCALAKSCRRDCDSASFKRTSAAMTRIGMCTKKIAGRCDDPIAVRAASIRQPDREIIGMLRPQALLDESRVPPPDFFLPHRAWAGWNDTPSQPMLSLLQNARMIRKRRTKSWRRASILFTSLSCDDRLLSATCA